MPKNRTPRIILALVLFFLIFLPLFTNGVDLLVDWLWFKQEGFRVIYRTILITQIQLSGLVGVGFMVGDRIEPADCPRARPPAWLSGQR